MTATSALGTLLWSSIVWVDNVEGFQPADRFDASPDLVAWLSDQWEAFCDQLPDEFDPEEAITRHPSEPGWGAWDVLAHDWILTRNHHGAGFWDGGWHKPWAERLTALAQQQPEIGLELTEEGLQQCPA